MLHTFRGGIHMEEYKITSGSPIVKMPAPQKVYIPLSQHIGAPCTPTVKVGDTVDKGQIIGVVEQGLGCPVHASVSGTVSAIEDILTPMGKKVRRIVIDNDGEERLCHEITERTNAVTEVTAESCITAVRMAGISGMGGATFPTYAKISSALAGALITRRIMPGRSSFASSTTYVTVLPRISSPWTAPSSL